MTTDNSQPISADEEAHKDSPNDDNGKTQQQIDQENRDALVKTQVSAPISESQVQPGREVVDGNGQRDTEPVEATRPDTIVDENIVTQAKLDAIDEQQAHGKRVQDKQNKKLNKNTKPGTDPSDNDE